MLLAYLKRELQRRRGDHRRRAYAIFAELDVPEAVAVRALLPE